MTRQGLRSRRILFVGMCGSVHLARWIEALGDAGYEIAVFPVLAAPPNAKLRNITLFYPEPLIAALPEDVRRRTDISIVPVPATLDNLGGEATVMSGRMRLGESEQEAPLLFGPGMLRVAVDRFRPDLIHSLELQHAGYLVQRCFDEADDAGLPSWIATNWGSDIYYYQRFPEHEAQIRRLLSTIDLYSCECERDVRLAQHFGYKGPVLPVFPNTGGFDTAALATKRDRLAPSRRKKIMVKGYQHFAGRALTSLAVIEKFADRLKGFEIVLYSMGEAPYQMAADLKARGLIDVRLISYADHDEMLDLFSQARIYLGISISDAISTSVLESMATGCFPIQTNTSCASEWFDDGIGGFLIEPDDFDGICSRFDRALTDDALVDEAAAINWDVIRSRLSHEAFRDRIGEFYSECFSHVDRRVAAAEERIAPDLDRRAVQA